MALNNDILASLSRGNQPANAPAVGARNRRANPLLVSAASEYVDPIKRPDQSTVAMPGGYYGGSGGNKVSPSSMDTIATRSRIARNSRTSPAGPSLPGGPSY